MIKNKKFLTKNEIFPDYSKEKENVIAEATSISNVFNLKKIERNKLNNKKAELEKEKVLFKFFNFFEKRKVTHGLFIKDIFFFFMIIPFLTFALLFTINVQLSDAKDILNKYSAQEISDYSNNITNNLNVSKMSLVEKEKYKIVKYYRDLYSAFYSFYVFLFSFSILFLYNVIWFIYMKLFKEKKWLVEYDKILTEIKQLTNELHILEHKYNTVLISSPILLNNNISNVLAQLYKSPDVFFNELNKKTFSSIYSRDLDVFFNRNIGENIFFNLKGIEHINAIHDNLTFYRNF